jgi:uncharacterized repeat protein (TIGR03803 family)
MLGLGSARSGFAAVIIAALLYAGPPAWAASEKVVYSFKGGHGGVNPYSSLIYIGGKLYGTTDVGGDFDGGTVFSVTPAGVGDVVYSFARTSVDGATPYAGLIYVGDKLYGTTEGGGVDNDGTVFSVTPAGIEKVMYSFQGTYDGGTPTASVIYLGGKFYGTTSADGAYGDGTVFSVTSAGIERVVHSFPASAFDGFFPSASLIYLAGKLYGTTLEGGYYGVGTVFSVMP